MEIAEKVVVVTGGASGVGRALCQRFAFEGAEAVVVADVDEEGAEAVAEEIEEVAVGCDVSKEEDVVHLIKSTEEKIGPIDLFCSNAGITVAGGIEVPNESWQRLWEVNVMAHVYAARALIPRMIERGGGAMLITASAAGLLSQIGSAPYSATKHAAVGLAENIKIMYGDRGIKVFILCPQAVNTPMLRKGGGGVAEVNGVLEPEEVADAVMDAFEANTSLILPHPQVKTYMQRRASDYERWLRGMQRLKDRYAEGGGE